MADSVRIDKYLWAIRVFKMRGDATDACKGNKVRVGGVPAKVEAARLAGLKRVLVPRENAMERFRDAGIQVVLTDTIQDAMRAMLLPAETVEPKAEHPLPPAQPLAAASVAAQG